MQHCFADNMVDRKLYVIVIVIAWPLPSVEEACVDVMNINSLISFLEVTSVFVNQLSHIKLGGRQKGRKRK